MPEEGLSFEDFDLNIESTTETKAVNQEKSKKIEFIAPVTEEEQKQLIQKIRKEIEQNRERFLAIINNLKSSRIFDVSEDAPGNRNSVSNIDRDFDEFVIRGLEDLNGRLKEFTQIPKPISYYTNRYSQQKKDKLLTYADEKEKMLFIFAWEIQEEFSVLLKNFDRILTDIMTLINQKGTSVYLNLLNHQGKRLFEDAKASCLYTASEIKELQKTIENWHSMSM